MGRIDSALKLRAVDFTRRYVHGDFVSNPRTLQEKIAHIKIFGVTDVMTKCADKLEMKNYSRFMLNEDICVPNIAVYDSPSDVRFSDLPDRFALKCNHGCHFNIVVNDKSAYDENASRNRLSKWLSTDYALVGYELQYHNIEHRAYAEKYVGDGTETTDYKFVCFNGVPAYCQIIAHRDTPRQHMNWYDMDFKLAPVSRTDFVCDPNDIDKKPVSFERMREYAERLSKPFDFVRVDFFELDGVPYLGEMTFTPANARQKYIGDPETGLALGRMLHLS